MTCRSILFSSLAAGLLALGSTGSAAAQVFSLDDDSSASVVCAPVAGFRSSENPFGLPAIVGPYGPSPSLGLFGLLDSDLLTAGPVAHIGLPPLCGVDAISANHVTFVPPNLRIRFSIDRKTSGLAGTASLAQYNRRQQPADIYDNTIVLPHPCNFVPLPAGGPFRGALPPTGAGVGNNLLVFNQGGFGLIPVIGPAVFGPAFGNGTHDNVDGYNDMPNPLLDTDGDGVTNFNLYYSLPPATAAGLGVSPAAIFDLPAGVAGPAAPVPPFAPAPRIGLEMMGGRDDIDGLVVWDRNLPLGPFWGGPGAEPGVDCAIFSLSPGSASLAALNGAGFPVNPGTIFVTDFSGGFAAYLYSNSLGLTSPFGPAAINVDALEVRLP